jgi:hypothetical protein
VKRGEFLTTPRVSEWLADQLASRRLRGAFTPQFADYLLQAFSGGDEPPVASTLETRVRRRARHFFPLALRPTWLMKPKRKPLNLRMIALRACIASISLDRLSRDGRMGAQWVDAPAERRRALPSALAG